MIRGHLPARDHGVMDPAPAPYMIRIRGHLGAAVLSAFPELAPQHHGAYTVLTGLLDQSALYGVLAEIEVARPGAARDPKAHPRPHISRTRSPPLILTATNIGRVRFRTPPHGQLDRHATISLLTQHTRLGHDRRPNCWRGPPWCWPLAAEGSAIRRRHTEIDIQTRARSPRAPRRRTRRSLVGGEMAAPLRCAVRLLKPSSWLPSESPAGSYTPIKGTLRLPKMSSVQVKRHASTRE